MPRPLPTGPSERALSVYAFIVAHKCSHDGNSPSTREIADGSGITSTSVANYYLRQLEKAGFIARDHIGSSRGIRVLGGNWTAPARAAAYKAYLYEAAEPVELDPNVEAEKMHRDF